MPTCPACGYTQNRDGARFCSNCAAPLAPTGPIVCPRCGISNAPGSRFCSNCAAPLTPSGGLAPGVTGMLQPNTLLQSRYVIICKLGQGGMGAVYQAGDIRLQGKAWAIKEMSQSQLTDPTERQNATASFRREAQLLAALDHPNLPKVVDFFEEGGKQYLVMDFVEGRTLEDVVCDTPDFLPEATVAVWVDQVCEVLEYLHACRPPIIFRDLKPGNIMLTGAGKVKLIDFGIARLFKPGQRTDTAAFGTSGYAAPEQFGIGQTDARSDIYALGVTMHRLLTKYEPGLSPFNLPPVRNINPAVSASVDLVVVKATRPAPGDRFQSATDMRQAVRAAIGMAPSAALSAPPISQTTPPPLPSGYVFAPGKIARTAADLIRFCEGDRDRAILQFYDGYFVRWLESIGEFGLASEAKRITANQATDPGERDRSLREWINRSGLSAVPPTASPAVTPATSSTLKVSPDTISADVGKVDFSKQPEYVLAALELTGPAQGALVVNLSSPNPWLSLDSYTLTCGDKPVQVRVLFDPKKFTSGDSEKGKITVTSNRGNFEVPVTVTWRRAILEVTPASLTFDIQTPFPDAQPFVVGSFDIRNRGSVYTSAFSYPTERWLISNPVGVDCPPNGVPAKVQVLVDGRKLPDEASASGNFDVSSGAPTVRLPVTLTWKKPVLRVAPTQYNFGFYYQNVAIQVTNDGGGLLKGSASADQPWVKITPTRFDSNSISLNVEIDRTALPPVRSEAQVTIKTNGGTQTVRLTANR